ncbi:MAG: PDZ domain-containing protein [Planctomycetota bacterium]
MRRIRVFLGLLALALCGMAAAETIETRDGQRFKGTVVGETPTQLTLEGRYGTLTISKEEIAKRSGDTVKLRLVDGTLVVGEVLRQSEAELIVQTGHGALTIPAKDVRWIGDELSPAAKAVRGDPTEVRRLHTQASRLHGEKHYRQAIALYGQLLQLAPDDATALYNVACGYSLLNEREDAIDYLERAVLAGFSDFQHIRNDADLDNLRQEPGYLGLLAEEGKWLRKAASQKTVRLQRELASRGCKGTYRVFVDKQRNFIWLHQKSEAEFQGIKQELDHYAEMQWRDLFRNRIKEPLHIVLLTREDGPAMLDPSVGGFFRPSTNTLICGDLASFKLSGADVTIHEFTHALHFADQAARAEPHPIWLVEGLGSLFETIRVSNDKVVPVGSARLLELQAALRRGRTIPWRRIMQMSQPTFLQDASLAYAQSRYMLLYMHELGVLRRFYDDYTAKANFQGDKTAQEAYEVAFGKPLEEVEADWKLWLAKQRIPSAPFLGIRSEQRNGGSQIVEVVPDSAAAAAKLAVGDVIVRIDGKAVRGPEDVVEALAKRGVGDKVRLAVKRGEQTVELDATLGERR